MKLAREMTKSLRRMIAPCAGVSALCSTGTQYDHHCCSSHNVNGGDLGLQEEWARAAEHSSENGAVQEEEWKEPGQRAQREPPAHQHHLTASVLLSVASTPLSI